MSDLVFNSPAANGSTILVIDEGVQFAIYELKENGDKSKKDHFYKIYADRATVIKEAIHQAQYWGIADIDWSQVDFDTEDEK